MKTDLDEKIIYLEDGEFTDMLVNRYDYPCWKARLIGGFCFTDTKEIFIRESRRGDIKLLNHERGHLRGFRHTLYPTLMFFSWIGRWFNSYYPPYRSGK